MKLRIVLALFAFFNIMLIPVHAQGQPPIPAAPARGNYVLDELGWISDVQKSTVNAIIDRLDQEGIAEIAVVILDDCGSDKGAFRKQLFDAWGIGHADDNDGLLILVCWYGGDASRRSVEQLYGRGLNWMLSSSKTDEIAQKDFDPAFQQGKPGDGLVAMVRDYNVKLRTVTSPLDTLKNLAPIFYGLLCFFGALIVVLLFDRFLPGVLPFRSGREREFYNRGNDGGDSFGGGSSSGGDGSSTRF